MTLSSSSVDIVPVWRLIPEQGAGEGALMIMRDGSFRTIMRVYPINFDMKAELEQDAILDVFGELLDSLATDFPLQIVVHKKRLDPEAYFQQFEPRLRDPRTPDLVRRLIEDHKNHFARQVRSYNLLNTEFYVIVSFGVEGVQVGERVSDSLPAARLFRSFSKAAENRILRPPDALDVNVAYQQLELRIAQVRGHLERVDIHCEMLGEQATVDLLYEFMHPGLAERQKLRDAAHTRGILSLGGDFDLGVRGRGDAGPRPRTAVRNSTPQLMRGDPKAEESGETRRVTPRRARRVGPSQTKPVRLPVPDMNGAPPPDLGTPSRPEDSTATHKRPPGRTPPPSPSSAPSPTPASAPAPASRTRKHPPGAKAPVQKQPAPQGKSAQDRGVSGLRRGEQAPSAPAAGAGPTPEVAPARGQGRAPHRAAPASSRGGANTGSPPGDAAASPPRGSAQGNGRAAANGSRPDMPEPNLRAETARRSRKRHPSA